ncbi:MAG: EAL domain-containing protein, partial [Novosphingobium sp.]|nr:EAL domain-containing protein [Novosphingobium sp.]
RDDLAELLDAVVAVGKGQFHADSGQFVDRPDVRKVLVDLAARVQQRVDDLREAAHFDELTGLCNRAHFQKRVEPYISALPTKKPVALFFIDLDGFKAINDTLGHLVGDSLLRAAADRLELAVRRDATQTFHEGAFELLARLGGDEFVFFIAHPDVATLAPRIASRIVRALGEPFEIGAHSLCIGGSVGIAQSPQDGGDYATLLRAADAAMYNAKRSGRGRFEIFDASLDEEARATAVLEQELRDAANRGSFELYYQPLYDLRTKSFDMAEALIRWPHPSRGLLLPRHFMHLADRTGMVPTIGEWVIGEAVMRIAEFERTGMPLQISINISPTHLERIDFISTVKFALNRWKVAPHLLQIEVTEEVALRDPELAADRLRRLSDLGVAIAIDDFGTGYSNLSLLTTLPISRLKIDKALLKDLTLKPEARVLVQTILSMANSLGLHTVAEGVETEAQIELLSAMGCDLVQGFFTARPMKLPKLREMIGELPRSHPGVKFTSAA